MPKHFFEEVIEILHHAHAVTFCLANEKFTFATADSDRKALPFNRLHTIGLFIISSSDSSVEQKEAFHHDGQGAVVASACPVLFTSWSATTLHADPVTPLCSRQVVRYYCGLQHHQ
jgi:hypothetical protein